MTKLAFGSLLAASLSGILSVTLSAHDPITTKITWTQEISRIVLKRCANCHRDRSSAFSLMSYDEARPWAKAIRDQVLQRRMPPWGAVAGVGEFRDDPSLTASEMDRIVNWVEGGAPKGDDAFLPREKSAAPREASKETHRRKLVVTPLRGATVKEPVLNLTAIRPAGLGSRKSMEVSAYLPDGEVRHLIWLRDYDPHWTRTYTFRDPIRLPRGAEIRVFSDATASAILFGR